MNDDQLLDRLREIAATIGIESQIECDIYRKRYFNISGEFEGIYDYLKDGSIIREVRMIEKRLVENNPDTNVEGWYYDAAGHLLHPTRQPKPVETIPLDEEAQRQLDERINGLIGD